MKTLTKNRCRNSRCGLGGLPKGITTEPVKVGEYDWTWQQIYCTCPTGKTLQLLQAPLKPPKL